LTARIHSSVTMYHKGEAAKSVRIHQEITSMSIMFVQAGNTSNKVHKD